MAKHIQTANTLVILFDNGEVETISSDHRNFRKLCTGVNYLEEQGLRALLSTHKQLTEYDPRFDISGGQVLCDGEPVRPELSEVIIKLIANAGDPTPALEFWKKLDKNPDSRSVEQLFKFLAHINIPIDNDGDIIAYKAVNSNFKDYHTGKVDNSVGVTNTMKRNKVSSNPDSACSYGFHVGSLQYASSFGEGDNGVILICKVSPENVVSVPYDCSHQKMRCCEYEVVGVWSGLPLPDVYINPSDYVTEPSMSFDFDVDELYEDDDSWDEEDYLVEEEVPELDDVDASDVEYLVGVDDVNLGDYDWSDLVVYAEEFMRLYTARSLTNKQELLDRIIQVRTWTGKRKL